jgi:hypothetical protein
MQTGAFYTVPEIVSYITKKAMAPIIDRLNSISSWNEFVDELLGVRVIDPTIGSGRFIVAALRELIQCAHDAAERHFLSFDQSSLYSAIANNCLYGVDIDPAAVRTAISTIKNELGIRCDMMIEWHIIQGDSVIGCFSSLDIKQLTTNDKHLEEALSILYRSHPQPPTKNDIRDACLAYCGGGGEEEDDKKTTNKSVMEMWASSRLFQRLCDVANRRVFEKPPTGNSISDSGWGTTFAGAVHWFIAFPEAFCSSHGCFDVVLSNPPWLSFKVHELTELKTMLNYATGMYQHMGGSSANVYSLILQREMQMFKYDGGSIGIVLPMSILSEPDKAWEREKILKHWHNIHIYPFSDQRSRDVFPDINQSFCVIIGFNNNNKEEDNSVKIFFRASKMNMEDGMREYDKTVESFANNRIPVTDELSELRLFREEGGGGSLNNSFGDLMCMASGAQAFTSSKKLLDMTREEDDDHQYKYISPKLIDPYKLQIEVVAGPDENPRSRVGLWWVNPCVDDKNATRTFKVDGKKTEYALRSYQLKERIPDGSEDDDLRVAYRGTMTHSFHMHRQICMACVIDKTTLGDHNTGTFWLNPAARRNPSVPQDMYFYVAILNSFLWTLFLRESGTCGYMKQEQIASIHCPLIEEEEDTHPPVSSKDFAKIRGMLIAKGELESRDLLKPVDTLFADQIVITSSQRRQLSLKKRTRQLASLIAFGARACESFQVNRTMSRAYQNDEKNRHVPRTRWQSLDPQSEPEWWKMFRCNEIIVNHLVARWYGISRDGYLACANRLKEYITGKSLLIQQEEEEETVSISPAR